MASDINRQFLGSNNTATKNSLLFAVCALTVLFVQMVAAPSTTWAYQTDDGAADTAAADTPAADAPAADNTNQPELQEGEEVVAQRSFLTWMIEDSGLFGLVLLLMSFIMVSLIAWNIMQVRQSVLLPEEFITAFEKKLEAKDLQGAYETAREDDSFIARVLAAGLSKLNRGYDVAIEGMQEVGEDESMALEHRLSHLALIGSVAPMVGLMGTVYGMINSFRTIATSATQPKPADLAEGISTALFTTLEGLTVAIPAIVFYSLLRNRVSRFTLEVGIVSEGLMSRFASMGKRSSSETKTPTSQTAP